MKMDLNVILSGAAQPRSRRIWPRSRRTLDWKAARGASPSAWALTGAPTSSDWRESAFTEVSARSFDSGGVPPALRMTSLCSDIHRLLSGRLIQQILGGGEHAGVGFGQFFGRRVTGEHRFGDREHAR